MKAERIKKSIVTISAAMLSACAPFQTGDIRIGDTPARRIVKDAAIPGKYVNDKCLPFANALHAKLRACGIPSKVVSFKYRTLAGPRALVGVQQAIPSINDRGGLTGAHAVVIYEDQGRIYVMDNQSWQPKWIHYSSPIGMAQQYSGINTTIEEARTLENSPRAAMP